MITRRFFLLVAAFLLLVDDNQPEIFERRKNCRARTHDDAGIAVSNVPPFACAFDITQRGVQYGDAFEACAKPGAALPADPKSEGNLRH